MLLRSYSYGTFMGVSELPPEVLNLFKPLVKEDGKQISYASEIVFAALAGKIKLDDSFNMDSYSCNISIHIKTIRKNEILIKDKKRMYESSYTPSSDCDDELTDLDYYSMHSANNIDDLDEYAKFEDKEFFQYSISKLKELNKDFIVYYGVDLIFCIKRALDGIPSALDTLKDICNNFDNVKDMVYALLTSEKDLDSVLQIDF